jgi:hypothetical protein
MQDFRKLRVWQFSQELTVDLYRCTSDVSTRRVVRNHRTDPPSVRVDRVEHRGGFEAEWNRDKARFFNISQGSTGEGISLLDISRRLGYLPETTGGLVDGSIRSHRSHAGIAASGGETRQLTVNGER